MAQLRVATSIRRTVSMAAFGAALAILAVAPVKAADPPASMAGMPDAATATAQFSGSDALDTAAVQFAALQRLDELAGKLLPTERVATVNEIQFQHGYADAWSALVRQVKAALPADQQAYTPGTRFAVWYGQVDDYRADAAFNKQFRSLFPAKFVVAHAALLSQLETEGRSPSLPAPVPTAPPVTTQVATGIADSAQFAAPKVLPLLVALALLWLAGVRRPAGRQSKPR